MDETLTKEELERFNERDRLFATSKDALSPVDLYQRMRYEREIEADEYVKFLKSGWIYKISANKARQSADDIVRNWRIVPHRT